MIFIVINCCVIVLRKASVTHHGGSLNGNPLPTDQLFGIISGIFLIYIMGSKAILGAAACCVLGLVTYYSYGKSRAHPKLTPWRTVRTELMNVDKHEREKRWWIFHTIAAKRSHPDYLNENEFVHAMGIIAPELTRFHRRQLFHEIDIEVDGIIDVDQFLEGLERNLDEQE